MNPQMSRLARLLRDKFLYNHCDIYVHENCVVAIVDDHIRYSGTLRPPSLTYLPEFFHGMVASDDLIRLQPVAGGDPLPPWCVYLLTKDYLHS